MHRGNDKTTRRVVSMVSLRIPTSNSKMRSLLLLLLSLMTGCETKSEVKGCRGGWFEFTCNYSRAAKPEEIVVNNPRGSIQTHTRETKGSNSLHHDSEKKLRVVIKQLQPEDSGEYNCNFDQKTSREKLHLNVETDGCQGQFIQTAYGKAKTTITCDNPGNIHESGVKFFCKENNFICQEILSTSSLMSNGKFSLTETNSGFSVSISNVSSRDAGVYWCGVKSNTRDYRTALRKIKLEFKDIKYFTRSPTTGQKFTYWCGYPPHAPSTKFICKGDDPSVCQPLVNTSQSNTSSRFSMNDDTGKKNITITVREVTAADAGTYWCGAQSTNKTHSNQFFHRFTMNVGPTRKPPTFPVSSPPSTPSTSAERSGGSQAAIAVIVGVAVLLLLLLLFVLIVILIKRFSLSKTTRNGAAAQNIREDYVYEEIQEHVQKPNSGNAAATVYDTVNFPTNPSASPLYCTINFKYSSDKAGGKAVIKPGSACEYSTVKYTQSPTSCTVNEPSRASQDPLYSTVNKAKK